jgi:hypothetical protein
MISNDGPKNIGDSVEYIASRVWADEQGRNQAGAVLIQEQRIFAARAVQKGDARPGAYVATGGHGGILGAAGHDGPPLLHYLPTAPSRPAPPRPWRGDPREPSRPAYGAALALRGGQIVTGVLSQSAHATMQGWLYRTGAAPDPNRTVALSGGTRCYQ